MRLRVKRIVEIKPDAATVSFSTHLGDASGQWVGELPTVGGNYEVEIEVPGVLKWNTEISETQRTVESVFEENSQVCIVGRLQSIDDDGVAAIQLCNDILLVEIVGTPSSIPCEVLIRVPLLRLFDTRL